MRPRETKCPPKIVQSCTLATGSIPDPRKQYHRRPNRDNPSCGQPLFNRSCFGQPRFPMCAESASRMRLEPTEPSGGASHSWGIGKTWQQARSPAPRRARGIRFSRTPRESRATWSPRTDSGLRPSGALCQNARRISRWPRYRMARPLREEEAKPWRRIGELVIENAETSWRNERGNRAKRSRSPTLV